MGADDSLLQIYDIRRRPKKQTPPQECLSAVFMSVMIKKLAGYVLAQYALFQERDICFQMSQGWTWRGMVRDWKKAVKNFTKHKKGLYSVSRKDLFEYWRMLIRQKRFHKWLWVILKGEKNNTECG